jgi:hypothetical protein
MVGCRSRQFCSKSECIKRRHLRNAADPLPPRLFISTQAIGIGPASVVKYQSVFCCCSLMTLPSSSDSVAGMALKNILSLEPLSSRLRSSLKRRARLNVPHSKFYNIQLSQILNLTIAGDLDRQLGITKFIGNHQRLHGFACVTAARRHLPDRLPCQVAPRPIVVGRGALRHSIVPTRQSLGCSHYVLVERPLSFPARQTPSGPAARINPWPECKAREAPSEPALYA